MGTRVQKYGFEKMYLGDDELRTLKESLRRFQMKSAPMAASLHSGLSHLAPETLALFCVDRANEPNDVMQLLCAMAVIVDRNHESDGLVESIKLRVAINSVQPEAFAKIAPTLELSMRQVFCNRLPDQYYEVWKAALGVVWTIIYHAEPTGYETEKTQIGPH